MQKSPLRRELLSQKQPFRPPARRAERHQNRTAAKRKYPQRSRDYLPIVGVLAKIRTSKPRLPNSARHWLLLNRPMTPRGRTVPGPGPTAAAAAPPVPCAPSQPVTSVCTAVWPFHAKRSRGLAAGRILAAWTSICSFSPNCAPTRRLAIPANSAQASTIFAGRRQDCRMAKHFARARATSPGSKKPRVPSMPGWGRFFLLV